MSLSTRSSHNIRTPQRQLSLYKFVTSCSDLLPAQLFSPFMHMLIGLSSSSTTAHCCFNFLKANSPSLGKSQVCINRSCFKLKVFVIWSSWLFNCLKSLYCAVYNVVCLLYTVCFFPLTQSKTMYVSYLLTVVYTHTYTHIHTLNLEL